LDDDQLDSLLDALAARAEQRDDLNLPGSGASRRGVLAGLLGLGGAAAGAGVGSAIGENESYGSSSGVVGTDSEPLNEANVQDLHAQDAQIDNSVEAEQTETAVFQNPLRTTDIGAGRRGERLFLHSFENNTGYQNFAKFVHDGGNNRSVSGISTVLAVNESTGGITIAEFTQAFTTNDQENDWGTAGDVFNISNNVRLKVGDDTKELFYQINCDGRFLNVLCDLRVTGLTSAGGTKPLK